MEGRHAPQIGALAGGDDDRLGGAALDAGAEEADVFQFEQGGVMLARVSAASNFSTGNASPVRLDCVMNRSLCRKASRTSAGIMSPAARAVTRSPGTRSAQRESHVPGRRGCTVAVTRIISLSFSAAVSARASCTKRSTTPSTTIKFITMPARLSPVAKK